MLEESNSTIWVDLCSGIWRLQITMFTEWGDDVSGLQESKVLLWSAQVWCWWFLHVRSLQGKPVVHHCYANRVFLVCKSVHHDSLYALEFVSAIDELFIRRCMFIGKRVLNWTACSGLFTACICFSLIIIVSNPFIGHQTRWTKRCLCMIYIF